MKTAFFLILSLVASIALSQETCELRVAKNKLIESIEKQVHEKIVLTLSGLNLQVAPGSLSLEVREIGETPSPTDFMWIDAHGTVRVNTGTTLSIRSYVPEMIAIQNGIWFMGQLSSSGTNPDGTPIHGICKAVRISTNEKRLGIINESFGKIISDISIDDIELYHTP